MNAARVLVPGAWEDDKQAAKAQTAIEFSKISKKCSDIVSYAARFDKLVNRNNTNMLEGKRTALIMTLGDADTPIEQ